jgi:hypothetical protein
MTALTRRHDVGARTSDGNMVPYCRIPGFCTSWSRHSRYVRKPCAFPQAKGLCKCSAEEVEFVKQGSVWVIRSFGRCDIDIELLARVWSIVYWCHYICHGLIKKHLPSSSLAVVRAAVKWSMSRSFSSTRKPLAKDGPAQSPVGRCMAPRFVLAAIEFNE